MKKFNNLFLFSILAVFAVSCQKHVVEYQSESAGDQAQFQLHYVVPVTSGSANDISKVELNGNWINAKAPLLTYNAIPSGAIGRFYATKAGTNNIKMYKGDEMTPVYDQDVDLKTGKQNVFVYDFNKPPVVIDNGAPFHGEVSEYTDTLAWIKFYNFLYEKEGVPTPLKLQYQYQYTIDNDTKAKSDWINLGEPVSFGEATDWIKVPVNKTTLISSGTARIDYRIEVINADGSSGGLLQVLNSQNKMVDYSDWWNATIGRRYHHIFAGMRTETPLCGIKLFTAL